MSSTPTPSSSAGEIAAEQSFVDRAYARLDDLRTGYREEQRAVHASHGVGNAQGWTEREAISAHLGDMATRLEHVEERLVFGRLDTEAGDTHYVGRTSLSEPEGQPLLIDWRAPAARPFYQATAVDPQGVVRRRHITTRRRTVVALEDELLDAGANAATTMTLQGEGALMSALNRARDGRMGDIVATIQAEQDAVIRADGTGLLVVQGGPGTGKTAVALHRAAYLLYTERERLERSGVLLIGPSRVFLRYIEQVLPSLGESGVVSLTLGDLVPGIHARANDTEAVAEAKGHPGWAPLLERTVRDLQRLPEGDQVLRVWNRTVTLRRKDVIEARTHARRTGKPHNVARDTFALDLIDLLARRIVVEAGDATDASSVDAEDMRMWTQEIRASVDARRAINLAWMPTPATTLLERLYARPELLRETNRRSGTPVPEHLLARVERPRGSALTIQDVPLLDELEEHLGTSNALADEAARVRAAVEAEEIARAREALESQGLGGGIVTAEMLAESARGWSEVAPLAERAAADRSWSYGHVVVDEAQELSPMAWRALMRRCPSRSFTVVGDLDQKRGHGRPTTWADALGPAARALAAEHVLTVSYRTPGALTRLAEDVMRRAGEPVLHPLTAVREVEGAYRLTRVADGGRTSTSRSGPLWEAVEEAVAASLARLDAEAGEGEGRVAVIVGQRRAHDWGADTEGYAGLEQRVSLIGAVGAKGLEFDHVVLVEPAEVLADGPGDLFVALTRATQHLHVVAAGELPEGLEVVRVPPGRDDAGTPCCPELPPSNCECPRVS